MIKTVFGLAIMVAALSTMTSPVAANDLGYERVGRWNVVGILPDGKFAYCAAEVNNGDLPLRIGTDGKGWLLAVPYTGDAGEIELYSGFGVAGEVAVFQADSTGWATTEIVADQVEALRQNPDYRININDKEEVWNLNGAAPALKKVAECAKNRGVRNPSPEEPADQASSSDDLLTILSKGWGGVAVGSGQKWPYRVKNVRLLGKGNFEADIVWKTLDATHRIKGSFNGKVLFFKEVAFVKRGNAVIGCEYRLPVKPGKVLKGTYNNCDGGVSGEGRVTVRLPGQN